MSESLPDQPLDSVAVHGAPDLLLRYGESQAWTGVRAPGLAGCNEHREELVGEAPGPTVEDATVFRTRKEPSVARKRMMTTAAARMCRDGLYPT